VVIAGALSVVAAGCADEAPKPSSDGQPQLSRACDPQTLRLHGGFSRALGSQFGAITISTTSGRTCQLHGGRPKLLAAVGRESVDLEQQHTDIPESTEPPVLTVPIAPRLRAGIQI
jgi:hypothetical protein